MIKLVVFDWNGTLFADVQASFEVTNRILEHHGKKQISMKKYRETITFPLFDFYLKNGYEHKELTDVSKALQSFYHKHYEIRASKSRARKGAKKLLKWLKQNKLKPVILSNHTVAGIHYRLKLLGLDEFVLDVLANPNVHVVFNRTSKRDRLEDCLRSNKYAKSEVIIVGDSTEEAEIGKQLGIKSVAITDGFYSVKRLKRARPDFLIRNLANIKDVIKSNGITAGK